MFLMPLKTTLETFDKKYVAWTLGSYSSVAAEAFHIRELNPTLSPLFMKAAEITH